MLGVGHTLIKFLPACPKDAWFDWDLRNLEARSSLVTSLKVFMVWQGTLSLWGLLSLRVDEHCIVTWCSMLLTSVSDSLNDDELRGDIDESVSVGWREKIICMSRILSVDRSVFVYKLITFNSNIDLILVCIKVKTSHETRQRNLPPVCTVLRGFTTGPTLFWFLYWY